MKAQRKEAAEYYRDNDVTVAEVRKKFKLSHATMTKALQENKIEVDRGRYLKQTAEHHGEQWRCPACHKIVRHYCDDVVEMAEKPPQMPLEATIPPPDGMTRRQQVLASGIANASEFEASGDCGLMAGWFSLWVDEYGSPHPDYEYWRERTNGFGMIPQQPTVQLTDSVEELRRFVEELQRGKSLA